MIWAKKLVVEGNGKVNVSTFDPSVCGISNNILLLEKYAGQDPGWLCIVRITGHAVEVAVVRFHNVFQTLMIAQNYVSIHVEISLSALFRDSQERHER